MFSSIMAKKSYKHRRKSEKAHGGCMSGLIHMLDFRRSPKLLSDGRGKIDPKGSGDIHGNISADNDKDHRVGLIYAGRASIKTLMEEEMASTTQPLKQAQRNAAGLCSEDIDLNLAASLMEIYRNRNEGQEICRSLESGHSYNPADKENNTDSALYLNQIPSSIQKALEDVAEAVIRHRSASTRHIISSGEAKSKKFLDALQLLSSDKELFLMLMQDRSSRLLECLENLYTLLGSTKLECEGSDEETKLQGVTNSLEPSVTSPRKVQRKHNSFLKEDKLVMRKPPKLNDSSRGLSRIVILKPSPGRSHSSLFSSSATSSPLSNHINSQGREDGDESGHHFSLRELKRRLRLALSDSQKDHKLNSMSSTLHKAEGDSSKQLPVASMSESLASTDSSDCKETEEPSIVDKNTVPEDSGSGMTNDVIHGVGSFSYEKAKMYLIERLNDQEDSSKVVHKSDSFERLISLPENDTFSPSHCSQEGNVILSEEATNPLNLHTIEQENGSVSPNPKRLYHETISAGISNLDNEILVEQKTDHESLTEGNMSQELSNEEVKRDIVPLCSESEISGESVGERIADQCSLEEPQSMNVLQEVAVHSPDDPINEQESHGPSEVVELVKPSVLTFPDSPENTNDREEKLSPQSVLDSVIGDTTDSRHKTRKPDELSTPTSRSLFKELETPSASLSLWNGPQAAILDDKEARLSFIKAVLEVSKLLSDDNSQRWSTEEPLLDISVLAEVGNLYCLTDDAVLLFDCVEEVLLDIRDRFFGVDPWVAFLKRNVRPAPVGRNLVQEVAKGVDSIVGNEFPNTLDHVVMKDLEVGSWMDLRHDAESIVIEVWDGLFDDLLEEMVFDLWL